jgi:hypothetical protein
MLSLLPNWKLYFFGFALLGIVSFIIGQQLKINRLDKQLRTCNTELSIQSSAIHLANQLRDKQETLLRLREKEAATARAESLKRKERIMQTEIKGGCEGAIQWMIDNKSA